MPTYKMVNKKYGKIPLSLSLSNRPPCPPSIIIIRWWIYNTVAEVRGSLGFVTKIAFSKVSYPLI